MKNIWKWTGKIAATFGIAVVAALGVVAVASRWRIPVVSPGPEETSEDMPS